MAKSCRPGWRFLHNDGSRLPGDRFHGAADPYPRPSLIQVLLSGCRVLLRHLRDLNLERREQNSLDLHGNQMHSAPQFPEHDRDEFLDLRARVRRVVCEPPPGSNGGRNLTELPECAHLTRERQGCRRPYGDQKGRSRRTNEGIDAVKSGKRKTAADPQVQRLGSVGLEPQRSPPALAGSQETPRRYAASRTPLSFKRAWRSS